MGVTWKSTVLVDINAAELSRPLIKDSTKPNCVIIREGLEIDWHLEYDYFVEFQL